MACASRTCERVRSRIGLLGAGASTPPSSIKATMAAAVAAATSGPASTMGWTPEPRRRSASALSLPPSGTEAPEGRADASEMAWSPWTGGATMSNASAAARRFFETRSGLRRAVALRTFFVAPPRGP